MHEKRAKIRMRIGNNLQKYSLFGIIMLGFAVIGALSVMLMSAVFADGEDPTPRDDEHLISVYDRGTEQNIITKAHTVRDALKAAKIEIDEKQDVVEPGLDEELIASKYNVNIYRAKPVTIIDGSLRQRVTTAYQTPKQIAEAANIKLYPEDKIETNSGSNLLVNGADTVLEIDRATPVMLTLYGKKAKVRTHVNTVGELLKEKDIKPDKDDTLSVPVDTPITKDMQIELWRNGKQTVSVEEDINFETEKVQDANREIGYREVKTPGEKGKKNVTYEIEMKNGQEISRKEIASVTTKEPKKQVEVVGAKPSFSGDFQAALAKLRSCEGGYNSWNASGPYYGAYQFDQGAWNSVTDAPYGNATPAQQDEAAYQLYLRRGWQPWPSCGASLPDIYR